MRSYHSAASLQGTSGMEAGEAVYNKFSSKTGPNIWGVVPSPPSGGFSTVCSRKRK